MKCTQCFKCVKLCLMLSLIFYTLFRRNKLFIVIEKANSIFFRRKIILKVCPQLTQKEHSTFTLNKKSFHFTNPKSSNAQCTFFSLKKETKKKHNLKNANSKSLDQFSESWSFPSLSSEPALDFSSDLRASLSALFSLLLRSFLSLRSFSLSSLFLSLLSLLSLLLRSLSRSRSLSRTFSEYFDLDDLDLDLDFDRDRLDLDLDLDLRLLRDEDRLRLGERFLRSRSRSRDRLLDLLRDRDRERWRLLDLLLRRDGDFRLRSRDRDRFERDRDRRRCLERERRCLDRDLLLDLDLK